MKKKLINSLIFFIILITIIYFIDYTLIKGLRFIKIGQFGVWNKIINSEINADIVFAGSSRTLAHFNPEIINSNIHKITYNIGMDGTELDLQLERLKLYLKYNKKPKVIIQGLEIFALKAEDHVYEPVQYIPYLNEDELYFKLLSLDSSFWKHKNLPLYSFAIFGIKYTGQSIIQGFFDFNKNDIYVFGYFNPDFKWNDDFNKFIKLYPNGKKYDIENKAIGNLNSIIELAKKSNINIILVYTPEYCENYKLTLNRDEIFSIFNNIADKNRIPFWDYSNTPITKNKKHFYNSQHLNKEGASIFSSMFAYRLKNYIDSQKDNNK